MVPEERMRKTINKSSMLAVAALVAAILASPGAVAQAGKRKPARVSIWSYTKEISELLDEYKKLAAIDDSKVQFEVILIDNKEYQSKLDAAFRSKKGGPDVFVLEAAYLGKYVESGKLADLSSLASSASDSFPYLLEAGTDLGGTLRALSYLAAPGGFYYRRSLAKKYFGTDDPAAVQERLANPAAFLEAARELKRASEGKVAMICSTEELFEPFMSARDAGWLEGDKVFVDPMAIELVRLTKAFRDEALDPRFPMWSAQWFQGMQGSVFGTKNRSFDVFGYFLPTWGLEYVLKRNARNNLGSDTRGDWGLVRGPVPYSWGGTWLAASGGEGADAVESLKFIKYCCTNEEILKAWAKETGDLVSSAEVAEEIMGGYSEPFLGGQNHYAAFVECARGVKGKNLSPWDEEIDAVWRDLMKKFLLGKQSEETFIQEFKLELTRTNRTAPRGIDVR